MGPTLIPAASNTFQIILNNLTYFKVSNYYKTVLGNTWHSDYLTSVDYFTAKLRNKWASEQLYSYNI